jgi:DNA-binding PucR family transcriptional regulator
MFIRQPLALPYVRVHTGWMAADARSVTDLIADVADFLLADLDQIGAEMDAAELVLTPALGADAAIAAEVSASNRANALGILTRLARRDGTYPPITVPPEALDVVRTVVRRGVDLDVIFQAYRRGQNIAWEHWMAAAGRVVPPGPLLVEVLQNSSRFLFDYVDQVIAQVIAEAQHEREEVLGGALARRIETVRLILDGAPIDRRRASERLDYNLDRRHTALVAWAETRTGNRAETGIEQVRGACESAVGVLAHAAGASRPLIFSAGTSTVWAWLGTRADPRPSKARDADTTGALREGIGRVHPDVRVAVGPTLAGITGFRRSHAAALDVQRLLIGRPDGERLAFHHDIEVTALVAQDPDRAAEFVIATLGRLAAGTATAARLRETLRVFLDEAENAPRAAERLHTHRNTVLQRVARATELLGRRPGERRLALELALELAHRLGPRVLTHP